MILLPSSEPLFAASAKVKGKFVVYYDADGFPACCNFAARPQFRECCLCHNCCVQFVMNEDGTYTCSACGKFPREILLT